MTKAEAMRLNVGDKVLDEQGNVLTVYTKPVQDNNGNVVVWAKPNDEDESWYFHNEIDKAKQNC